MNTLSGVDISSHQFISGDINYQVLKDKVDFIMIKTSEGGMQDPKFQYNRIETRKVGKLRGYYHFARADLGNSPEVEAKAFTSFIDDLQEGEVLCLDFEICASPYNWGGNPVDWCYKFFKEVQSHYPGYKPMLYTNLYHVLRYDWKRIIDMGVGLWLSYPDDIPNQAPSTPWPVVAMKQYSFSGRVEGILGDVDLNIFYGDSSTFLLYGYHPIEVAPPIVTPQKPEVIKPAPTLPVKTTPMQEDTFNSRLKGLLSRKFLAVIFGCFVLIARDKLGISVETGNQIVVMVIGYLVTKGYVDSKQKITTTDLQDQEKKIESAID